MLPIRSLSLLLVLSVAAIAEAQPAAVDAAVLLRDLEVLAADAMEGRRAGTPGGVRARDYIVRRFKEIGIEPFDGGFVRPFTARRNGDQIEAANVVGVVHGTRGRQPVVVVTAHYDHLGVRNGEVYNGADDNASGVAALLAVAAALKRAPPEHSVILAALDAEEAGLLGAREFLRNPPVPVDAIALNVNLDMVARDARNRLYAVGTYHYPALRPLLEGVARPPVELLFGHDVPNVEADDWTQDSDHAVFHARGIPFVYFGVEDEEHHHEVTDDVETVTKAFFVGAVETAIEALRRLDANLQTVVKARAKTGL